MRQVYVCNKKCFHIIIQQLYNKYSLFINLRYAVCDGNSIFKEVFVSLIFQQEEFSSYGIDWDGPISSESSICDDVELVEIPNIQVNIREKQQQQLSLVVDPLSDSDCHGIDLYIQTRNFLHSLT